MEITSIDLQLRIACAGCVQNVIFFSNSYIMISFLNRFIKSRKYYIIDSIDGELFRKGARISFKSMKHISRDYEIFIVKYNGVRYVLKCVEDEEWRLVRYLISKKTKCPHLITYYACICKGNKKFILMQKGDVNLQDYYNVNPYYESDVWQIAKICFESQLWMINHLHLINRDLKLDNLIRFAGGEHRIIDLELMEPMDDIYKVDLKDLRERDIDNQMYPRRRCNYQQFAYFSIAILILELLAVSDSLLTGRQSDNHLVSIIDDLSFFNESNDRAELADFLKQMIQLEYGDFAECHSRFVELYNKFWDRFVLD